MTYITDMAVSYEPLLDFNLETTSCVLHLIDNIKTWWQKAILLIIQAISHYANMFFI